MSPLGRLLILNSYELSSVRKIHNNILAVDIDKVVNELNLSFKSLRDKHIFISYAMKYAKEIGIDLPFSVENIIR